jgi:transposase
MSESLLYNWRSAWKAAAAARALDMPEFLQLGVIGGTSSAPPAMLPQPEPERRGGGENTGGIEIALPSGARVRVDAAVNERALSRVLRAMKGTM